MADKIPFIVDSLDGIDNADAYSATEDGKFMLSAEHLPIDLPDGYAIENTDGLRNSLRSTREERDAAKREAAKLKDLAEKVKGLDIDEVRSVYEKFRKGEIGDKEAAERYRREVEKEFGERERKLTERLETIQGATLRERVDAEFNAAVGAAGAKPALLAALKASIRAQWVEDDRGARVDVHVVDERGEVRWSRDPNRRSQPMSVAEYVESFRSHADFGVAFPKAQGGAPREGSYGRSDPLRTVKGDQLYIAARTQQLSRG